MRVLHITTEFPPVIRGGLGTAVGGLADRSARCGITVGVLLINAAPLVERWWEHDGQHVPTGSVAEGPERRTASEEVKIFQIHLHDPVETVVQMVREWRPDVLHLHMNWEWAFVQRIVKQIRIPLVYTLHSVDRAEYEICRRLGYEPLHLFEYIEGQESIIALADRLIALTQSEGNLLTHYYPHMRDKVRVVGNGVNDCERARRATRRIRNDKSALVLYVGRLTERKGVTELFVAIPYILERAPQTRFVIAGGPPSANIAELERQWIPRDCIRYHSQIHFTGWLPHSALQEWYCAADIQVVPSWYEPFGMAILEGMLHGLPIIASTTGGSLEILDDCRSGLLFPPANVEAFQQAILRLVKNPKLRRQLGRFAAREVRRKWLWSNVVEKVLSIYTEVAWKK